MTQGERTEVTYEVTISVPDGDDFAGFPTEHEVQMAIYRGIRDIDSEDAVSVVRL